MASAHTHVEVGLFAGTIVGTAVLHLSPEALAVIVLSSGGAALLPDLDTRDSAASHVFGELSVMALTPFRWITLGHRKLTHTLLWAVGMWALIYFWIGHLFPVSHGLLPPYWPIRLLIPVGLSLLAVRSLLTNSGAFKAIVPRRHLVFCYFITFLAVGYLCHQLGTAPGFVEAMALAFGVGSASHVVADAFFESGVPMFFPIPPSFRQHVAFAHFPVYNESLGGRKRRSFADHLMGDLAFLAAIVVIVLYLR
jgi:membrane-bound metal-dependent hydrolase YbcI (DUF457 family)